MGAMSSPRPASHRVSERRRSTSESSIELSLDLDGTGSSQIDTTVPFFDHLLTAFAKHSLVDLTVRASGDTHIDVHHTVEDTAIVLGAAIREALGDKSGIGRYGDAVVPLDEALAPAARTSCTPASPPATPTTSSAATSPGRSCATSSRRSRSTRA
jgi:imidazoleglycerol-phosphate dehydratase